MKLAGKDTSMLQMVKIRLEYMLGCQALCTLNMHMKRKKQKNYLIVKLGNIERIVLAILPHSSN